MNATTATSAAKPVRRSNTTYRVIRQLHLWIGAWGALAAILYGFTGLVMNHRFGDGAWPQGDSNEKARVTLQIPADAQTSPEALSLWLRQTQQLDAQVIRKGPPGGGREGAKRQGDSGAKGGESKKPDQPKWTLSGGSASDAWSMEYTPGNTSAEVKHTEHSTLAAFNRLHKAVGGGIGWTILADSFAIAMLLLGLSGIWMWARGRNAKELVLSVMGASIVVLLVVLVPALF
ncbi:PepSY-associated TM helix domain-containing protein [Lysobacter dokdonensis DS-58]|uniref:PepSY-associated TM helix domain-containing protein n=1 Tax=Lysobacter dokdonensis DS-58 TaxID=1300345 RepID=A0A0A2WDD0_9GAMM|nr:PepSY-associated TM helix domain-containing protein [Lysobacter dokdonensis]KGQ17738.1 PepSY-associated TM helix domain-containing protein [Lysobacter dokdonensis DS-58]